MVTGNARVNYLSPAGQIDPNAFGDRGRKLWEAAERRDSQAVQNVGDEGYSPQDARRVLNSVRPEVDAQQDQRVPHQQSMRDTHQQRSERQLRMMAKRCGRIGC